MARWLLLALVVIVLDQITKQMIVGSFSFGEVKPIMAGFNLVLAHNTGAAFSFLAAAGGWQRHFFTVLALAVTAGILWMLRTQHNQWRIATALSLIMGGALGNVIDRVRLGYVVDFIQVYYGDHYWPSFNVADSAICIGAALLVIDSMLKPNKQAQPN
jgi:signal peptidase II